MSHVDGNAIIGALSLATGTDVAHAHVVCGDCGHDHHIAHTRVYLRCPGIVIRCPNCDTVEIMLVEIDHRIELTLRAVARLDLTERPDREAAR